MAATTAVGILTVSDRCSRGEAEDKGGPALAAFFASDAAAKALGAVAVAARRCVPDDVLAIQAAVKEWCDRDGLHLVVTTGGTGFAPRDVTPEAVRLLLDKEAPALAQHMVTQSLAVTPMAVLSRPVAGVRGRTLVVTVPGSPKGAVECVSFLLPVLPHCLALLRDAAGPVAAVHTAMQAATPAPAPRRHVCSHASDDAPPTSHAAAAGAGVADRPRTSPYAMVSMADATAAVLAAARAAAAQAPAATVPLAAALGLAAAADVHAPHPQPAFAASVKDGYAVRAADTPGELAVVAAITAGDDAAATAPPLAPGTAVRITTGAPLPPGADAVVQVEDTVLIARAPDGREEARIAVAAGIAPGTDVRAVGSDVAAGERVLAAGDVLGPAALGVLASCGLAAVSVRPRATVAVLSSGDEVVDVAAAAGLSLRPGQIWDSNRPALLAALHAEGVAAPTDLGIVADDRARLAAVLRAAVDAHAVVVTSGGVSMGERDLLKAVLTDDLGGAVVFGRVRMKPGKPTTFVTVPRGAGRPPCLVFALPGNPVSCSVGFYLFVRPALRALAGHAPDACTLPAVHGTLRTAVDLDPRPEYQRARVLWAHTPGEPHGIEPVDGHQASSRLGSLHGAAALLILPAASEGCARLEPGAPVSALLLPGY